MPCPRLHRRDDLQNDERDSHHQVPHRSHLLPRDPCPRLYLQHPPCHPRSGPRRHHV